MNDIDSEQVHHFSKELSRDLGKVLSRFIDDMILGICRSRSLRLTMIARALDEDISLHATHKRLCRHLADHRLSAVIRPRLLQQATARLAPNGMILLHPIMLHKTWARNMDFMAEGDEVGDDLTCKLWDAIGCNLESNLVTPIAQAIWSARALQDYGIPENRVMLDHVGDITSATDHRALLVAGRSLDRRDVLIPWTEGGQVRYMVRQRPSSVLLHKRRSLTVAELEQQCEMPFGKMMFKYPDGMSLQGFMHVGTLSVRLPECPSRPLNLLVVKSHDVTWTMLTTEPLRRNRDVLFSATSIFFRIFEMARMSHRLVQELNYSDVRVLSFPRIKNLLLLATAATQFMARQNGLQLETQMQANPSQASVHGEFVPT